MGRPHVSHESHNVILTISHGDLHALMREAHAPRMESPCPQEGDTRTMSLTVRQGYGSQGSWRRRPRPADSDGGGSGPNASLNPSLVIATR